MKRLLLLTVLCMSFLKGYSQSNCATADCGATEPPVPGTAIATTGNFNASDNMTYVIETGNNATIGNVGNNATIYVEDGATLNFQNTNDFAGTIIVLDGGLVNDMKFANGDGMLENWGTVNFQSSTAQNDVINNYADAVINISGDFNVENSELVNCGNINQTSGNSFKIKDESCFINSADAIVDVVSPFTIEGDSNLDNFGVIKSTKDIIFQSTTNTYNACTFFSETKITIGGSVINDGLILSDDPSDNSPSPGEEKIEINGTGDLTNNATIIGSEFLNSGDIDGNGGSFNFSNITNNNSTLGSSSSNVNFIDNSGGTQSDVFDTGSNPEGISFVEGFDDAAYRAAALAGECPPEPYLFGATISGIVVNDATSSGTDSAGTDQLYAVLVDSDGNVFGAVPVNSDGTYAINNVLPGDYTVVITTTDVSDPSNIGSSAPTPLLPSGWSNTNDNNDGDPNGSTPIEVFGTTDVTDIDFNILEGTLSLFSGSNLNFNKDDEGSVSIYPSIISETLSFDILIQGDYTFTLISSLGQVMATKEISTSEVLDMSHLSTGQYFYLVRRFGEPISSGKIIKN